MKKKKLKVAFEALQSAGYFAKQNFQCCSSCGWAAISKKEAKKAVFYHMQDNDDLKEKGYCYLTWSGKGSEIVEILNDNGIKTEWNGNKKTRIKILI